jgi:ribosomal protein L40E
MHTTRSTLPQVERRKVHGHLWRLLTLALLLVPLLAVSLHQAPVAQAGGGGPIIHWDSSMIYAGQNNGYPWGPVGENTIVHGANFSAYQQLHLVIVPGDSNNDAVICKQLGVTVDTVTTNSSGTFDQNFPWPATAGQVNEGYSICGIAVADGSVVSRQDDGPFTVLASNPPIIDISSTTVQAGGTVTVTGHNWVPPQQVSINIAACAACEPGSSEVTNVNTTSTGLNDGAFSLAVTIPASTKPGNYVVDALTPGGLEAYYTSGVKHLTITAAGTIPGSTATPSPSPTATATMVSTATPAATATTSDTTTGTNSDSSNSGGKSNTLLIIVLVVIALVLFAIAGVIIFMLLRRSPNQAPPVNPAQYMQNMQPNGSSPNFDQLPPMQNIQPGWPPSNFGQPAQRQGSITPYFGQQMSPNPNAPSNNFGQAPICMNCGRPLPPNAAVCSGCGMQQVAAQGPNGSTWVR